MKVKNLNNVIEQLKPFLKDYLETQGTEFTRSHFTCPNRVWHKNNDAKPSCAFYPDESSFHCFSCGKNGSIFDAANLLEGLPLEGSEFIETVVELAKRFNITVEIEEDSVDKYQTKLKTLLELVRDVAYKTYLSNNEIREYVKKRGVSEIEDKVKFGYLKYDSLLPFLTTKGYTENDIKEAGLFRELLNERLIIPIYDSFNRLVAFGSRKIKEDQSERYYLSSTCQVYKKSEILFNFNNSKQYETIYIVEGFLDAFQLIKNGIPNVVAVCGDAISYKHIRLLVKYKVKKVILLFDSDNAGKEATKSAISALSKTPELEVYIKELSDAKDPDEYLLKYGKDKFLQLPESSMFDYKLKKYIDSNLDKNLKEDLLQFISEEQSFIEKEHMCKKLAKAASVKTETVLSEIERIEKVKLGDYGVTTSDIVNEKDTLNKEIFLFESWSESRGKLLGLNIAQWPIMTEKLDGFQNALFIVAAEENTGKSALTCSLSLNLALSNPGKVFILYFGLDVSNRTMIARMVANLSGLPINTVSNPKYKILENPTIINKEELMKIREEKINQIRLLSDTISIKDEKTIRSIEDMERLIKVYLKAYEGKQLVVIIDSLNQMHTAVKKETRDIYMYISDKLKEWTVKFDIPVIAISELRKLAHPGMRPTNDDIKEVSDLKYDADVTILLYNELHSKRDSSTRTFIGEGGIVYPIVELIFYKNKTSEFKGTLFYKFYTDTSRIEECTIEEMRKYWSER